MSCAHAVDFFAAYQAMLSVNQQTIAGAQQSAAKPALFSNPKTRSISCPKTGRAARDLLNLSWAARRLETCLKRSRVSRRWNSDNKCRQIDPGGWPHFGVQILDPKMGSGFHFFFPGSHFGVQNLNPKMGSAFESFFLHFAFLWLRRCSIHRPAQAFIIAAAQKVATIWVGLRAGWKHVLNVHA